MQDKPKPKGYSTVRGFTNCNGQINMGRGNPVRRGSNCSQYVYVMHCPDCDRNYGANGGDVWERKCPNPQCQDGEPGEPLCSDELDWRP